MVNSLEPAAESAAAPDGEILRNIYKTLMLASQNDDSFDSGELVELYNEYYPDKKISFYAFSIAIEIFRELGLLNINEENSTFKLSEKKEKRDLKNSRTFRLEIGN